MNKDETLLLLLALPHVYLAHEVRRFLWLAPAHDMFFAHSHTVSRMRVGTNTRKKLFLRRYLLFLAGLSRPPLA